MKKNARKHSMNKLLQEVAPAGLHVCNDEDSLKRKIKNSKDCYRNEFNKMHMELAEWLVHWAPKLASRVRCSTRSFP